MPRSPIFLTLASDANTPGTPANNPLTGDRFTVRVEPPIVVPADKYQILPVRATSWHTSPNISGSRGNNQFTYTAAAPAPNPGTYNLTLPDALYGIEDLEGEIASQMVANGHGTIAIPIISFTPLVASGKVQLTFTANGYSVDFTIANSIREVIGFGAVVLGPSAAAPETFTGTQVADFPQGVNSQVVNVSIVKDGYINGVSGNALIEVPLSNTSPNRQVTVDNNTGYQVALASGRITAISVWLTDQSGRLIGLNNNLYSVQIALVPLGSSSN